MMGYGRYQFQEQNLSYLFLNHLYLMESLSSFLIIFDLLSLYSVCEVNKSLKFINLDFTLILKLLKKEPSLFIVSYPVIALAFLFLRNKIFPYFFSPSASEPSSPLIISVLIPTLRASSILYANTSPLTLNSGLLNDCIKRYRSLLNSYIINPNLGCSLSGI